MKRIAAVAVVLSLAAAPAFAESTKMSEAQLDQVTGGLADVSVNATNVANPTVSITVNPTVTANPSVSVSVL